MPVTEPNSSQLTKISVKSTAINDSAKSHKGSVKINQGSFTYGAETFIAGGGFAQTYALKQVDTTTGDNPLVIQIISKKMPENLIQRKVKFNHQFGLSPYKTFSSDASSYYIFMKKIEGCDLHKHLRNAPQSISKKNTLIIITNILDAIGNFQNHPKGPYIHRDIKLENIIINPKTLAITLIDFDSIEKLPANKKSLSAELFGSPDYTPLGKMDVIRNSTASTATYGLFSENYAIGVVLACILDRSEVRSTLQFQVKYPATSKGRLSLQFDRSLKSGSISQLIHAITNETKISGHEINHYRSLLADTLLNQHSEIKEAVTWAKETKVKLRPIQILDWLHTRLEQADTKTDQNKYGGDRYETVRTAVMTLIHSVASNSTEIDLTKILTDALSIIITKTIPTDYSINSSLLKEAQYFMRELNPIAYNALHKNLSNVDPRAFKPQQIPFKRLKWPSTSQTTPAALNKQGSLNSTKKHLLRLYKTIVLHDIFHQLEHPYCFRSQANKIFADTEEKSDVDLKTVISKITTLSSSSNTSATRLKERMTPGKKSHHTAEQREKQLSEAYKSYTQQTGFFRKPVSRPITPPPHSEETGTKQLPTHTAYSS